MENKIDFEEKLFELFTKHNSQYKLYSAIIELCDQYIEKILGSEMSKLYSDLAEIPVSYSFNEASNKKNRDLLNKIRNEICNKYEKYLS
jgi:septation ring formation regulator EzrA